MGHQYDRKGTNDSHSFLLYFSFFLFLVGSDLDHKIKQAAAQLETAWEGMGQTPEVRVWRIEKFKVRMKRRVVSQKCAVTRSPI